MLSLPSVGDRYVISPLQDSSGNIDNVIGTRTLGDVKGNYLVTGPDWTGDVSEGLKHYPLHTNIGFIDLGARPSGVPRTSSKRPPFLTSAP